MKRVWPQVIRDPVHDLVSFDDNRVDRLLLELINTAEFQRLRRVNQLGMTEMVFPAANHSRFAHCLGVLCVARRMLDHARDTNEGHVTDEQREAVLVAALLHDVGHGPFSHAFEKVTGEKHERRTLQIIQDPSTDIHRALRKYHRDLPRRLTVFFDEDVDEAVRMKSGVPPAFTQIVSSQFDADRADYLLRDSYATGTNYGKFDLNWLILQQRLDDGRRRFYFGHKAKSAAEAYVFARHHMYQAVYFHKTTRSAEVMLRLAFTRYRALLQDTQGAGAKRLVADAPPVVLRAFSGQNVALPDYLSMDDATIREFLKACGQSSDKLLSRLSRGIMNRELYKAIDITDVSNDAVAVGEFTVRGKDFVKKKGFDPQYSFVADTAADTPYKPYDPDASKPATQLYLETSAGAVEEISNRCGALEHLKRKYTLVRYYFPRELRDGMEKIARDTLGKGGR
jgi:HD superfamily phosphohydrolase